MILYKNFKLLGLVFIITVLIIISFACESPWEDDDESTASSDCRVYITSGTGEGSIEGTVTASFHSSTLEYSSTVSGDNGTLTTVLLYNSISDFIDEARIVGKILYTKMTRTGEINDVITYTYDSDKRLTKESRDDGTETTFTTWDSNGRTLTGTTDTYADCDEIPISIEYDDINRTMTVFTDYQNGTGADCPDHLQTDVTTYDSYGNIIKVTGQSTGQAEETKIETTISTTDQICK